MSALEDRPDVFCKRTTLLQSWRIGNNDFLLRRPSVRGDGHVGQRSRGESGGGVDKALAIEDNEPSYHSDFEAQTLQLRFLIVSWKPNCSNISWQPA
jgi:hypothetical protein